MTGCPLCESRSHIVIDTYDIDDLSGKWLKSLGFDPFETLASKVNFSKLRCTECGLMYFNPPFFGDTKFYERLSRNAWYYESRKWEYDEAAEIILKHKPASLLEIGCGSGAFLEKITSVVPNVEGIDINDEALKVCRGKGLNVTRCDISSSDVCKLTGKKYEMVVLFEVIEHLDNPGDVFRFIDGILAENGIMIMAMPNPAGYFKYIDVVLLDMPPHHNTAWSKEVFEHISKEYKWTITDYSTEPLRYVHYAMYLASIAKLNQITNNKRINSFINKLNKVAISILAPFYFATDQKNILGQTHMVVFQKTAQNTI